jgi:hypothetical protein
VSDPAGHVGVIYLLHFSRPYRHARHYTGWTESSGSLKARLAPGTNKAMAPACWRSCTRPGSPGNRPAPGRVRGHLSHGSSGGASRRCPLCLAANITEGADPWPTA